MVEASSGCEERSKEGYGLDGVGVKPECWTRLSACAKITSTIVTLAQSEFLEPSEFDKTMSKRGWVIFVIVQVLGAWIPTCTNIHSNIAPLFAGLLLLPGILVWFLFPHSSIWPVAVAIPINAIVWYFIVKAFRSGLSFD
jgi:hypothetical protein